MNQNEALKQLQSVELEILVAIAQLCEKHAIRWFLDGGTLLGAARHQGFIPWDDDIDIGMLREDYEKFLAIPEHEFPAGYSLHTFDNTPGYAAMFAKVYKDGTRFMTQETREAGCEQAIFVDVFPYDYVSLDATRAHRQRRGAKFWQSVSYLYHAKTIAVPHKGVAGTLERAACCCAHYFIHLIIRRGSIKQHFDSAIALTPDDGRLQVLPFAWPNIEGYELDEIFPTTLLLFEGNKFPSPAQWDIYLTRMYGDWRKLPRVEERKTHLPLMLDFGYDQIWRVEDK